MARRAKQSHRLWTPQEDSLLREKYPHEGVSVAKTLNRSVASVSGRVQVLGLSMTPEGRSEACSRCQGTGVNNGNWKGHGRIGRAYVNDLKRGAKRRNMEYTVLEETPENFQYLNSLVTEICPLSGLSLTFRQCARDRTSTASLDRIDPKRGYIRGNVRWIHKDINRIKWDMTDEVFLSFVRDIAKTWGLS